MNRPARGWHIVLTVFLSGCVPLNVNVNQTYVAEEPTPGLYCEGIDVTKILESTLPDMVEVDTAKSDKEVADRLVDHIGLLQQQQRAIIKTLQESCKSVRRI